MSTADGRPSDGVDLYWLPLGASGHVVGWNGRIYERLSALRQRRAPLDLFRAALLLRLEGVTHAVEMAPVWNVSATDRGVVLEGPVGVRRLGRFRAFRYEVRCWPGGAIPDIAEAVDSPVRVTESTAQVRSALALLPSAPALTWGRDEIGAGDMWNSNSIVAWLLARSGVDIARITPPAGGRAPGWDAGVTLAGRQRDTPRA